MGYNETKRRFNMEQHFLNNTTVKERIIVNTAPISADSPWTVPLSSSGDESQGEDTHASFVGSSPGTTNTSDLEELRRQLAELEADPYTSAVRQIIADALNLPLVDVPLSTSFIQIGGDANTAMVVMARCKDQNIVLQVPDILACRNLLELSFLAKPTLLSFDSNASQTKQLPATTLVHLDEDAAAAGKFWEAELRGARSATFPAARQWSGPTRSMRSTFPLPKPRDGSLITSESIFRAAWALVLGSYSEMDDICFGVSVSGRQAPLPDVENMIGPTSSTVPVRVRLEHQQHISEFLRNIQIQTEDMMPHEHFGLTRIASLSPDAKQVCDFSSLLSVQPASLATSPHTADEALVPADLEFLSEYENMQESFHVPLVVRPQLKDGQLELHCVYDSSVLSEFEIQALSQHFAHVSQQLLADNDETLNSFSMAGSWDLEQVSRWNSEGDSIFANSCVHDLITEQVARIPDHEAIYSWDGTITYTELEHLSDCLADHLFHIGVRLEDMVPICFEKSMWAIVAMLGILKAGGVYVPLNPQDPVGRRQAVIRNVKARFMVVSPSMASSCDGIVEHVVQLSSLFTSQASDNGSEGQRTRVRPTPSNAAYVITTSGSTGLPKSIVVEHFALCSSITAQSRAYSLGEETRFLQFSSYSFDASAIEILMTLVLGGTVCVPSDAQRLQDVAGFMNEARVNTAVLTPSFATTLRPDDVPGLKTLILGGEAPSRENLKTWYGHVKLISGYGPTETVIISVYHIFRSADDSPTTIGHGLHGRSWIIDLENHQRLAPIGCVGELVIQGPVLARGYLNDEKKTAELFVEDIDWAPELTSTVGGERFYKTGDLARYNPDGTIEYMGRRDTQVKLRGQRIEMAEIEHNIKMALPGAEYAVVEMIRRESGEALVAFISFSNGATSSAEEGPNAPEDVLAMEDVKRRSFVGLSDKLGAALPPYMIPSLFLPLRAMPFITSMKLDRKRLRSFAEALSPEQFANFSLSTREPSIPLEPMELKLRDLWAEVLHLPADSIGRDDSFMQIGGDSISAIHLASAARDQNIALSVSGVFQDSRLFVLAAKAREAGSDDDTVQPFGMVDEPLHHAILSGGLQQEYNLPHGRRIEDAYPCTPMQEGLMALAVKQPGSYTGKFLYRLGRDVDIERFRDAWDQTVRLSRNLRTRIVLRDGVALQLVVEDDIAWQPTREVQNMKLSSYREDSRNFEIAYGSTLSRYALIRDSGNVYFYWIMHHAVFDGWTVRLLLDTLISLYEGRSPVPIEPYSNFVKYCVSLDHDAAREFWTTRLKGANKAVFPRKSPSSDDSTSINLTKTVSRRLDLPQMTNLENITHATLLRAAWAIILARYNDTTDITFGATISGRQAPIKGVTNIAGPLITTLPIRVCIDKDQSVRDFLQSVQDQAIEMTAFDQFGVQNISRISPVIREVCDFSSLMVIQPFEKMGLLKSMNNALLESEESLTSLDAVQGYFNYPLIMQGMVDDSGVDILLIYDSTSLQDYQAEAITRQFEHLVYEMTSDHNRTLREVSMTSAWDREQAFKANSVEPVLVPDFFHALVEKQALLQPLSSAVEAWDGCLTYSQLNMAANRLAHHLVDGYDVKPGDVVHLCLPKSVWYFVSILAVNKAGAIWCPLDPSHPVQRRRQIVTQTGSKLCLVSSSTRDECAGFIDVVLELGDVLDQDLIAKNQDTASTSPGTSVSPDSPAYILFTSGSTGLPKGFLISHRALCTSSMSIWKRLGMTADVRMLQFASFVFDMSVGETVGTLILGGTICVPSEDVRRHGLVDFIREFNVNWVFLTPTFARTIDPSDVPSIKLMILAGEMVGQDILKTWFGKVRLVNGWGPAETTICSTLHEYRSADEPSSTIGTSVGSYVWLVDPDNPRQLAPYGTIGEAVIQGPTLFDGYLADPNKTEEFIIRDLPDWAPRRSEKYWDRFYKSGDYCRYNANGTLEFVGRKDSQIKIRGFRVELSEIEHHVRVNLPHVQRVAVEAVQKSSSTSLVCFFSYGDQHTGDAGHSDNPLQPMSKDLRVQLSTLVNKLRRTIPDYMIPQVWVPMRWLPTVTSVKLDRRRLLEIAKGFSEDEQALYSMQEEEKRAPRNELETRIRNLWACLLEVSAESISIDDNFYQMGGDSIRVITLSRQIEKELGVNLVRSLINTEHTTVADMARQVENANNGLLQSPCNSEVTSSKLNLMKEIQAMTSPFQGKPMDWLCENSNTILPNDATVFLTGASGYLGGEILRHFLRDSRFKTVITHLRAQSPERGMKRLAKRGQICGWWKDEYRSKIEVWIGDLNNPRMGLDDCQWKRLIGESGNSSKNIDAIVHNGAIVNWNAKYAALHHANVQTTVDLLKITMTSPAKPKYIFISGGVKINTQEDIEQFALLLSTHTGYAQTKFVAETVVNQVALRLPSNQNRISVIKPGRIIGTPEEGTANIDDYTWRIVGTAIATGCYPLGDTELWMPMQTIDWISSHIISTLTTREGVIAYDDLHLGMPTTRFWDLIKSALPSPPLSPVSWDDWTRGAIALANRVGEKHPLYPIQNFIGPMGSADEPREADKTWDHLTISRLDDAVTASVKYLASKGYFELCKGHDVEMQAVMKRSTVAHILSKEL